MQFNPELDSKNGYKKSKFNPNFSRYQQTVF